MMELAYFNSATVSFLNWSLKHKNQHSAMVSFLNWSFFFKKNSEIFLLIKNIRNTDKITCNSVFYGETITFFFYA